MRFDYVVVGAGLTGATLAERLASEGRVLVIEKRNHIAGNAWDERDESGLLFHRYGPHIFHTNSDLVWQYLSRFTEWTPYIHKVKAWIDGSLVPVPFNLNSIDALFPSRTAEDLTQKLIATYGWGARVPILKMLDAEDEQLQWLSKYVYKNVFEGYTKKQWGLRPEELAGSVTGRVPVIVSRDDRYFQDTYQAMPKNGYSSMVGRMLDSPNISVMLGADWSDMREQISFDRLFFTGPIDEYFNYVYGHLPYRSLRFAVDAHPASGRQPAAVINFPNEHDFTRITDQSWLTGDSTQQSTKFITEYPCPHTPGKTVPYYPIPTEPNRALYARYSDLAEREDRVTFAGRLGDYMYYNMDQAVARALKLVNSGQA